MEPLFSIVTVTFNASSVISPTLLSVNSQSFSDYEHLIVDGASSDDTLAIARNLANQRRRIVSEPDKGLYDAMNKSIALAKGKYIIFLNAGDSFSSNSDLQRIADCAASNPDIIYGQTQLVNSARIVVGPRHLSAPVNLSAESFKHGMLVCHQAFIARRSIMPLYDLSYRFSADFDWCIKCLKKSKANVYVGDAPIINFLTDGITDKHHADSLKERFNIMCRNYGTLSTILLHISFIPRFLLEKHRKSKRKKLPGND